MSHYITLPIDANGVIDPDEQIEDIIFRSMSVAFGTTDVFVYCHGWWTDADAALKQYNIATTDFIYRFARPACMFRIRRCTHFLSVFTGPLQSKRRPTESHSFLTR
jgi:hypothetical protein